MEKLIVNGIEKITIPAGTMRTIAVEINGDVELEVNVEQKAELIMLQIAKQQCNARNVVNIGENASVKYGITCLASGSIDMRLNLQAPGANAAVGSIFLGKNEEDISLNTIVNHSAPSTTSSVKIYGALKSKAKAKSTGNIKIEKIAQKANAFLASHALLLDKHCRAQSVPALEIEANDVKAGHSASTSKLSQEELFYCSSRGLEQSEAEKIIVFGFLQKAFTQLPFNVNEMVEEKWTKT